MSLLSARHSGRWNRAVVTVLIALGLTISANAANGVDSYVKETEAWKAERVAALTKPDGWLSLIGLHFLTEGANTVGSAKDNDVVLASGPARVGVATVSEGKVMLKLDPAAKAQIDGQSIEEGVLKPGEGRMKPTLVTAGTVTFFVIERGGKKALRVKDSASQRLKHFVGLDYFPVDPSWRIEARWVEFEKSKLMPITNMIGQTSPAPIPGKAVFERDGKTYELLPIDEGRDEPLFFVISDKTSGSETYGAARFLYAAWPKDGKVILDFNRTENPPCAFTPFATCPLPPKENRLPIAVNAGEKNYRGEH